MQAMESKIDYIFTKVMRKYESKPQREREKLVPLFLWESDCVVNLGEHHIGAYLGFYGPFADDGAKMVFILSKGKGALANGLQEGDDGIGDFVFEGRIATIVPKMFDGRL
jgi:hypothetical protein